MAVSMNENDQHTNINSDENQYEYKCTVQIPFQSVNEAVIAYNSLRIDSEPHRSRTKRVFKTNECELRINFYGKDLRSLRVSVNSTFELINLIIQTLQRFSIEQEKDK